MPKYDMEAHAQKMAEKKLGMQGMMKKPVDMSQLAEGGFINDSTGKHTRAARRSGYRTK